MSRSIPTVTAAVSLFLSASARPAAAQDAGAVEGRVTAADGSPVVGAFVSVDGGARPAAQTDAQGRYRVGGLTPGRHAVEVRRTGYATGAQTVLLTSTAGATADVSLARAAALAGVTVIGTRGDLAETRERVVRVPGGAALVESAEIRASRQANLKDVLKFTPGVYIQPRFGAADESQISVRGSGLRNNYHARGNNLLVNGMPYRNADGFTDFESLELLNTEAIEVYKGANALRYGGSTLGGAIALDTKTGYTAAPLGAFAEGGGFGFQKEQLSPGGAAGGSDYYASYAHTGLGRFRAWADQRRDRVNLHAGYRLSATTDLRTFYFFAHAREHLPGSVDAATLAASPDAADPTNVAGRWGRDYALHHVGVQFRAQLTPTQRLEVSPYLQYRDIDHPIYGVINQQSHDVGAEVRYENTAPLGALDNRFTLGLQPASERMHDRQFANDKGAHGVLTRDEQDRATTAAVYVAGQNLADRRYAQSVQVDNAAGKFYEPADRRSFYAGVRLGR